MRIHQATRAITTYKKMKVKTTSLPCRVIEAQRLINVVRDGTMVQQSSVRKMIEKSKLLEVICKCQDDDCPFLELDSDRTRYCTCVDWESTSSWGALQCKDLEVVGHQSNRVFKIGEGFLPTESHEPDPRHQGTEFDSDAFEDYLTDWQSTNDTRETGR
jgi:hypothetical protein